MRIMQRRSQLAARLVLTLVGLCAACTGGQTGTPHSMTNKCPLAADLLALDALSGEYESEATWRAGAADAGASRRSTLHLALTVEGGFDTDACTHGTRKAQLELEADDGLRLEVEGRLSGDAHSALLEWEERDAGAASLGKIHFADGSITSLELQTSEGTLRTGP
jgi:hypothetical protein